MPYFNKGNDWSAKFMAKSPFKQSFFKDLGRAVKSIPKAIKEGPVDHFKKMVKKK